MSKTKKWVKRPEYNVIKDEIAQAMESEFAHKPSIITAIAKKHNVSRPVITKIDAAETYFDFQPSRKPGYYKTKTGTTFSVLPASSITLEGLEKEVRDLKARVYSLEVAGKKGFFR